MNGTAPIDGDHEHERRFIVSDLNALRGAEGDRIEQGYLWAKDGYAVRVRLTSSEQGGDPHASFALKGPRLDGQRFEIEQPIPISHARSLYERSTFRISKVRYPIVSENETWVVDVFEGANDGLVIAEFEASAEAVAAVRSPWWCSQEVTADARYDNENLARTPFTAWPTDHS